MLKAKHLYNQVSKIHIFSSPVLCNLCYRFMRIFRANIFILVCLGVEKWITTAHFVGGEWIKDGTADQLPLGVISKLNSGREGTLGCLLQF